MSQRMDRDSRKSQRHVDDNDGGDLASADGQKRFELALRAAEDGNQSLWVRASLIARGLPASSVNALFAAVAARPHAERGAALASVHPALALRVGLQRTFGNEASSVEILRASTLPGRAEGVAVDGRVHLAPGLFDLTTTEGKVRLGHEVAHTLQQRRGERGSRPLRRAERRVLESEAETAGQAFSRGERFKIKGRAPAQAALYRGQHELPPGEQEHDGDDKKKNKNKKAPGTQQPTQQVEPQPSERPSADATHASVEPTQGSGEKGPVAGSNATSSSSTKAKVPPSTGVATVDGEQTTALVAKVGDQTSLEPNGHELPHATTPPAVNVAGIPDGAGKSDAEPVALESKSKASTIEVLSSATPVVASKEAGALQQGWQGFDRELQEGLVVACATIEAASAAAQQVTRDSVKQEVRRLASSYAKNKRATAKAYDAATASVHSAAKVSTAIVEEKHRSAVAALEGQRAFARALIVNNFALAEAEYRARGNEAIAVAAADLKGYKNTAEAIRRAEPASEITFAAGNMPQRRYDARIEAATKVHDETVGQLKPVIDEQITKLRDAHDERRTQAFEQLDQGLDQLKKENLDVLHARLLDRIRVEEKQLVKQLAAARKAQLALLAKTFKQGKAKLEANGVEICGGLARSASSNEQSLIAQVLAARLDLQTQLSGGIGTLDQSLQKIDLGLSKAGAPKAGGDSQAQGDVLQKQRARLVAGVDTASSAFAEKSPIVIAQLTEGAKTIAAQLATDAQTGIAGMQPAVELLLEVLSTTAASAKKQSAAVAHAASSAFRHVSKSAEDLFADFEKNLPGMVNTLVDNQRKGLFEQAVDFGTQLKLYVMGGSKNKEGQLEPSLMSKMSKEADKAASAVQPRWKAVLKWVVMIVVIIAVIVFAPYLAGLLIAVLEAVMSTFLATLLGGAIIGATLGAASSGVIQIAHNAIDLYDAPGILGPDGKTPLTWDSGLKEAVVTGLWTGAIGGAIGGAAGKLLRPLGSFVVDVLSNAGLTALSMGSNFDMSAFIQNMSIGTAISLVMSAVASRGRARMTFRPTEQQPVVPRNVYTRVLDAIGKSQAKFHAKGTARGEAFVESLSGSTYTTYGQRAAVRKIAIVHDESLPWTEQELADLRPVLLSVANKLSHEGTVIERVVKTLEPGGFDPETRTLYVEADLQVLPQEHQPVLGAGSPEVVAETPTLLPAPKAETVVEVQLTEAPARSPKGARRQRWKNERKLGWTNKQKSTDEVPNDPEVETVAEPLASKDLDSPNTESTVEPIAPQNEQKLLGSKPTEEQKLLGWTEQKLLEWKPTAEPELTTGKPIEEAQSGGPKALVEPEVTQSKPVSDADVTTTTAQNKPARKVLHSETTNEYLEFFPGQDGQPGVWKMTTAEAVAGLTPQPIKASAVEQLAMAGKLEGHPLSPPKTEIVENLPEATAATTEAPTKKMSVFMGESGLVTEPWHQTLLKNVKSFLGVTKAHKVVVPSKGPAVQPKPNPKVSPEVEAIRAGSKPGVIRDEASLSNRNVVDVMNNQLQHLSASDVETIFESFPVEHREQARLALAKATEFGNMESFNELRSALIPYSSQGYSLYRPGSGSLADNLFYLSSKDMFKSLPELGDVGLKSHGGKITEYSYVLLDDVILHKIEFEPGFAQSLIDNKVTVLQVPMLENGINMFNSGSVDQITTRLQALVNRSLEISAAGKGEVTFEAALKTAMTERSVEIIDRVAPKLKAQILSYQAEVDPTITNAALAEQMNSGAGMSEAQLAAEFASANLTPKEQAFIREMLVQRAEIFSPRRLANEVAVAQEGILAKAASLGVAADQIYYFIPEAGKSYGMMALVHRQVTGTSAGKYVNGTFEANALGPNTMLVVFDDVAGSGSSLWGAASGLKEYRGKVLVKPMMSTEQAKTLFAGQAAKMPNVAYEPINSSSGLMESEFWKSLSPEQQQKLQSVLGDTGFADNALSMVFPYMAPDNNNALFGGLLAKYYIMNQNQRASKSSSYMKKR